MAKRFGKRRWRRPERMLLDHGPVMRRKDLGVTEPLAVEPELARRTSRHQIQILLGVFVGLSLVEGAIVGLVTPLGWPAVPMFGALALVYFFVARELGDGWIADALGAEPATGPRVNRLAASEAATAKIPAPRVLVAPGELPNAASFALRRRSIVTTAASEDLDELALEGLVAHEIVHLRDGDATVASLYVVLTGAPDLVARGALPALVSVPLWPVCLVLRALRSVAARSDREHRADVAAAMLTRYPPGIVQALTASGGKGAGLGVFDPFWFVARDGSRADAERRAELVGEM